MNVLKKRSTASAVEYVIECITIELNIIFFDGDFDPEHNIEGSSVFRGLYVQIGRIWPVYTAVVHAAVAPSRNYLTMRRFLEEIEALYGDLSEVVITDGAMGYGVAFGRLRIHHVVLVHGVRNRIERGIQELKRRIDTFYASFTGHTVEPTHNWLRQFGWFWNHCLS